MAGPRDLLLILSIAILREDGEALVRSWSFTYHTNMADEFFLSVQIEVLAEGGFLATSKDLPGSLPVGTLREIIKQTGSR